MEGKVRDTQILPHCHLQAKEFIVPDIIMLPLLLLVHLQILQFTKVNEPQYDLDLFTSNRGLTERTKSMEDICYFLVECGEGKNGARRILGTYPCLKPSDSTIFRTSIAKYLEALCHNSLRISAPPKIPYWWKDVTVRRSLLEECAGEKFMRLLVAFSTHVLFEKSKACTEAPTPAAYAEALSLAQPKKNPWTQAATSLQQIQGELETLRVKLLISFFDTPIESKYSTLASERLTALRDAKLDDIRRQWNDDEALDLLLSLQRTSIDGTGWLTDSVEDKITKRRAAETHLPVAAAHYPSQLRRIRKPVFESTRLQRSAPDIQAAQVPQDDGLRGEARMNSVLRLALMNSKSTGMKQKGIRPPTYPLPGKKMTLWEDTGSHFIDLELTLNIMHPTASLKKSSALRGDDHVLDTFDDDEEAAADANQTLLAADSL
ncbi:hypothetical protein MPER_12307 [Moniliophthora perniciosa FA553]|nr:hypothetical protein MPER_12307 [Moniliophthora perniciosa FA553]